MSGTGDKARPERSARNRVESDRRPGDGRVERNCSVPHIRREKNKPSRHRLNRAAYGALHGSFEGRFSEFDPALLGRRITDGVRNRHIVAGTDPALGVDMIGVEAAITKPRRPGTGKGKSGL